MKKKENFIKSLIRPFYEKTFIYKNKVEKLEAHYIKLKQKEISLNEKYINNFFSNDLQVQAGPFKGMKYIKFSSGSALFPKLIGCYEESIQYLFEPNKIANYTKIIDVGCAEGYYAIGLALNHPSAKIIACDIDESAISNLNKMINLNKVSNVEVINYKVDHEKLETLIEGKTLLICDIEGGEEELLDLDRVIKLKNVDIILEVHDCFVPGLTQEIISRFYKTHQIVNIVNYSTLVNKYEFLTNLPLEVQNYMTDEFRPEMMNFLYLKSFNGQ
jgi:tRNA G46 methylase TrmB